MRTTDKASITADLQSLLATLAQTEGTYNEKRLMIAIANAVKTNELRQHLLHKEREKCYPDSSPSPRYAH
ncbi:MAG: hypothetical protein DDT26_01843 [Dehalococcoidia bacterium]|nr:hypothetical protein [Chloroflexota bacterium]